MAELKPRPSCVRVRKHDAVELAGDVRVFGAAFELLLDRGAFGEDGIIEELEHEHAAVSFERDVSRPLAGDRKPVQRADAVL